MQIDQGSALELLRLYKDRIGQKQSWRAVQRFLAKTEHPHAFLVTSQKLANWNNPKRRTELEPRAFEAVLHFVQTTEFQELVPEARQFIDQSGRAIEAGSAITELAGIYPPQEIEELLYKALEGMWCDRENLVYLYIHKVNGHNFAVVHLCQKIHEGYKSALGFPKKTYFDFHATGFLYFDNETHSNNKEQFPDHPRIIGEIEKFGDDSDIYRIGVSGKKLQLKLWSRETRNEVTFEAGCYCSPRDSGYEPTADKSISVSSFFEFSFSSKDGEEAYRFDKANYVDADGLVWNKITANNVQLLKEKFDEMKWSVLPNVSS